MFLILFRKFSLNYPICFWIPTVFSNLNSNCSNLLDIRMDLIELIDFYFRLHFVFILISIHILQYKECGQSWKLILRKLHFLIFILVVMGHHDFKIWTSNWVEFSSNLYFWKTDCHFFVLFQNLVSYRERSSRTSWILWFISTLTTLINITAWIY